MMPLCATANPDTRATLIWDVHRFYTVQLTVSVPLRLSVTTEFAKVIKHK